MAIRALGAQPVENSLEFLHRRARRNLAEESSLAAAGVGDEPFRGTLGDEIRRKFPGAEPKLIDPDKRDHALQIYAYLLKQLPFHVEFERFREALQFHETSQRVPVAETSVGSFNPRRMPSSLKLMPSVVSASRR